MPKRAEILFGKVESYDTEKRVYTVSMEDGRLIHNCRKIGDITSNTGARKVNELEKDVAVVLVLRWDDDFGVDAPEGYILGSLETYGAGQLGTMVEKESQSTGSQGFIDRNNRRVLLHPDGTIELRSAAWCQFMLDPEDNSVTGFFQNMEMIKDKSNKFQWIIHPKSDDLKDTLAHLCISGIDSLTKDVPDIEMIAGALNDLKNNEYFHADQFEVDPGAKVAVRITNPDVENPTNYFQQIGAMEDGSVSHTKITHAGGVELEMRLGDIESGEIVALTAKRGDGIDATIQLGDMDDGLTGNIMINNITIKTFSDGRFQIMNDGTELEGTNEGVLSMVCTESYLGTKKASKHIALAEDVINIFSGLFSAIKTSFYQATAPGAPTKPGPLNQPQFDVVEQQIDLIKSTIHLIDK